MSLLSKNDPQRKKKIMRETRLPIIARLMATGMTMRKMAVILNDTLQPEKNIAVGTVGTDVQYLLKEWRDQRVKDVDLVIQAQLEIIDHCIAELFDQWEKSKTDFTETHTKQIGAPAQGGAGITASRVEKATNTKVVFGDPRYIAEIRALLDQRNKLLGIYPAEKKDITSKGESIAGGFYDFLKKVNTDESTSD